uniref:Putative sphingomyelin phosphodiesterase ixodes scapularis sphingomyelin phosphodiesterase n=1 Tax=Ixodes ricinus TaxID=34613 RepID=A0A090X7U1_IXORI
MRFGIVTFAALALLLGTTCSPGSVTATNARCHKLRKHHRHPLQVRQLRGDQKGDVRGVHRRGLPQGVRRVQRCGQDAPGLPEQRQVHSGPHQAAPGCVLLLQDRRPRYLQRRHRPLQGRSHLYHEEPQGAPATRLCTVVMGSSCGPLASPVHNWTVPLNGRPKPAVDARTGRGLTDGLGKRHLRVLHVSDTHYDPEYEPGSNGACSEPMCCRKANGKARSAETMAGKWGYLGKCDIPLRTLESMLQHASQNHKIDMILWTGDLPPHDPWKATKEQTISNLRVTSQLIQKYFPNATVLPAIGNHESVPINSFPVPNKGNYTVQWLYDEFANHWMDFPARVHEADH